jgi:hypothetical protein
MKTKIILWIIAGIIFSAGTVFVLGYTNVFYTKTVVKSQQNADREVFKETQSYNDGMAQELSKLKLEYEKATDPVDRNAIEFKIKHDYADFNEQNLQSEGLKAWLIKMRGF